MLNLHIYTQIYVNDETFEILMITKILLIGSEVCILYISVS